MVITEKQIEVATEVKTERPVVSRRERVVDREPAVVRVQKVQSDTDTAFEIEKEYTNFKPVVTPAKQKNVLPAFQVNQTASVEEETQKQVRISTRGKIIAVVFSVIVALLTSLIIYNIVSISRQSTSVARTKAAVESSTARVSALETEYTSLSSEESIVARLRAANSALKAPSNADKARLTANAIVAEQSAVSTNWFDRLCEFLSGMFS